MFGHKRHLRRSHWRQWTVGVTSLSVVAALSLLAPAAQADLNRNVFELDKNATSTAGGQPAASDDWDDVFSQITADANNTGDDDKCVALGAVECAFVSDPQVPTDTSIFTTGGSKDDLDIPNWRWTSGSVPDANEILDAYAIKYDVAGAGADAGQMLYFGADRFAVNGSKDFGFWFFHDEVTLNPDGTFEGEHTGDPTLGGDDILILGTFTQGGATATVRVFRWVGTGGNATANGTVAGPVDSFGDCVPGAAGADGCATVNSAKTASGGWAYVAKSTAGLGTNEIPSGGFVEGGIDLTDLGLEGCFSSFVAETRSSPSVDAQLKDFVLGQFEACGSTTTTTPKEVSGTVGSETYSNIPADGVSIGTDGSVRVADEASVVVNGTQTYGGSVSFRLCGPTPLSDTDYTLCTASTGVAIGAAKSVSGPSPSVVRSDETTVTSAGRYCWLAAYSGDATARVPGSTDSSVTECFKVLPVRPTLDTDAGDGPVDFGNPVTDTATLTGTAKQPGTNGLAGAPSIGATNGADAGGTITFSLFGPGLANCNTLAAGFATAHPNGIQRAVSGDGTYPTALQSAVSYTPTAPGTYFWKASYGGNAPNTLASDYDPNTAGDQVHNADCLDGDESVVVRQIATNIQSRQRWFPNDTATITSSVAGDNLGAGGSVVFGLYDNATCADPDGPTGLVYTETKTLTGGANSETVGTNNTTFEITTAFGDAADSVKAYSWKIVYTPAAADTAHTGKQSACNAEHFSITYTNDNGPGTALP